VHESRKRRTNGDPSPARGVAFELPPRGSLTPNGPDDPLPYYYHPLTGWLYRGRIGKALSLLEPPYESILELGYGSGILLATLSSLGRRVCGIDLESDPGQVAANLSKLGVTAELARGDVRSMEYPEGSFDLVVAISVFEHIREPGQILGRVAHLLKKDGHLLVGMPRVDAAMTALFSAIWSGDIKAHHVTSYHLFLREAKGEFDMIRSARLPGWAPEFAALYHTALFRRC
jgi:2-polyprenyl-3-methyl-5-hydroxy-6-metoxy-1,4-benzoquinol methylase